MFGRRTPRRYVFRLATVFGLALAVTVSVLLPLHLAAQPTAQAAGNTHYVAPGGNCGGAIPCYATVQDAVDAAAPGDEILVASGLYAGVAVRAGVTQTVYINKNVTLRGGFTTTNWLIPAPTTQQTILDAQSNGRVIYIAASASPTIEGFVIRLGNAGDENGGGIYIDSGSPVIRANSIYSNTAFNGGGIYNYSASPRVERNFIYSNTAAFFGGGFFNNAANLPTLQNNIFYQNQGVYGGGLGNSFPGKLISLNDVYYQNSAANSGGGLANSGGMTVTNAIIVNNTAITNSGGIYDVDTATLDYLDIWGNSAPTNPDSNVVTGAHSIAADPLFVDAANGDFNLTIGSPARDAGLLLPAVTDDFAGKGRPFGATHDIGALEYTDSSACYARVENGPVFTGVQPAINAAGSGKLVQVAGRCDGIEAVGGLNQTAYISQNLTLRGGYTVTDWLTPQYGAAILDAQSGGRVLYITGTAAVTVENLRLTGGSSTDNGAGVYIGSSGGVTLQNNVIDHNSVTGANGGGVYNSGSGDAALLHNAIYGNSAQFGGGLYASGVGGGGVVTLRSSIVVSNTAANIGGGLYDPASGDHVSLGYNNVFGNSPTNYGGITPPATDTSLPPAFVDAAAGNFHLTASSGLINAADPASPLAVDFDNQARPQGSRADIGPDESLIFAAVQLSAAPESPVAVLDPVEVAGKPVTFTHTITNAGALSDTFDLTISNSNGWPVSRVGITTALTLAANGSLTFKVVVSAPGSVSEPLYNQTVITAVSRSSAYAVAVAHDVIAGPGAELTPSYTRNADPGEVLTYTHTLRNTGPVTDEFTIDINSPQGWGGLVTPLPTETLTLGPDETAPVIIRVEVASTAPANLADVLTVTATSLGFGVSASVTDTTTANATTGDRFVAAAPQGSDENNNCTQEAAPCATISHALNQAANGDTVYVAQGNYNDSGLSINLNISLLGGYLFSGGAFSAPGGGIDPSATVIDAGHNGRGLNIQVVPVFQPEISGFTLKNAATTGVGGAIYVQANSAPYLNNLIIMDSAATRGGGIYIDRGNPTLANITIAGAQVAGQGGGIYINSGSPMLENVVISSTTATEGGGLYLATGSPVISNATVLSSTAARGGAMYQSGGNLTGLKLTFENNQADAQGGGLYLAAGTQTISQSRVGANTATDGGGIYAAGNLSLWNSLIYSNTATTASGGGVFNSGVMQLVNNTLLGNQAATFGGAIFDDNTAGLTISNTLVVSNSAVSAGGGLYRSSGGSVPASIDYNNVWGNSAAASAQSNVSTGAHSIAADPLFVTVDAANDDFLRLTQDSPAVDAAAPDTFLNADIEDDLRPVGQGFDMGADEVSGCLAIIETTGERFGVVQDAVDAAGGGDVVQIAGLCRGVQSRLVGGQLISQTVFVDKAITLQGLDDPLNPAGQKATLDALGLGRVAVLTGSLPIKIENLQLTGGNAAEGGGLYNYNNILEIENSVITGNQATYGGGLYNQSGTLTVGGAEETSRTFILSNTATYGGGLYLQGGEPQLSYVTIQQNSAQAGGGLYNAGSQAAISQTRLVSNTAVTGGGLYNAGGQLTAEEMLAGYNQADDGGGVVNNNGAQLSLQRSVVLSNAATTSGGGLRNTGVLTLVNTIVASNSVTAGDGGGLYNLSADMTLRHDTFYANNASGSGGGLYHNAGSAAPVINGAIVVGNSAGSGGGIYSAGANPTFAYNVVAGNSADNYGGGSLSAGSGSGNLPETTLITFLSTDPASEQFLRIPAGSPAEDTAQPLPGNPVMVDIDQDPRPSNQGFDMGVDEVGNCYVRINGLPPTYGNIQLAVDLSSDGDEIRVAGACRGVTPQLDGGQTVSQTLFLTKSLTIRGGYTKDNWLTSDPDANVTTLDALNLGRTVYITGSAQVDIIGLHLTQGLADNGGALLAGSGALTMTYSQIYSNNATLGGALYSQAGAAVALLGDNQLSGDNLIFGNTAAQGGAVYNAGGQLTLDDNTLADNQAASGGALYHAGGESRLQNNVIRGNTATSGGAIYNNAAGLSVWHNTFWQNEAGSGSGAGAAVYSQQGAPDIRNNIFARDAGSSIIYSQAALTLTYNNIFPAGGSRTGGSVTEGSGIIAADPLLTVDFHLADNSPVIDQGDPAMQLFYDFDGPSASPAGSHLRPGDQGFDMGADELPSCRAKNAGSDMIYGNIQTAINASSPGDSILVTADECRGVHPLVSGGGTVSQTVHITHNLSLLGGYNQDFSQQVGVTTLNPLGLGRALLITNTDTVLLSYFTLQNGNAAGLGGSSAGDAGGGLYNGGGASLLSNVEIYSNTAQVGGGLFNASGVTTMTLINSKVWSNTVPLNGGGLYHHGGALRLERNEIYRNIAAGGGGGLYIDSGPITFEENKIYENRALNGGGLFNNNGAVSVDYGNRLYSNQAEGSDALGGAIYNIGDNLTLQNTFIYRNTSYFRGGAIYLASGSPRLVHNTFYLNSGTQGTSQGGAVFVAGGSPIIKNNIFDENSVSSAANGSAVFVAGGSPQLEPNDYSPANVTGQVKGSIIVSAGSNLNVEPPGFVDEASDDFALASTSGLIDDPLAVDVALNHDFEDNPRPINLNVDMGADEYNACLVKVMDSGNIYGRIQPALDEAPEGTEVRVAEGACFESLTINKPVKLSGSWDASFGGQSIPLITSNIDASLESSRVITVNEINGTVTIEWLNIVNGDAGVQNGGGIWSRAHTLNLPNTVIANNKAQNGGGVYIDKGSAVIDTVDSNTATNHGGGVYITAGITRTVDLGLIESNQAGGDGGGVYIGLNSTAYLNGSAVGNSAGGDGGGIYSAPGSTLLENGGEGALSSNQAGGNGGGAFISSARFEILEDFVGGNEADNGGGLYITGSSFVTVTNAALYSNTARSGSGGGVYRDATGSTRLIHNTIHYNSASDMGGGVYNNGSGMVISASIVAFNQSPNGGSGINGAGGSAIILADSLREPGSSYVGYATQGVSISANPLFNPTYIPSGVLHYNSPAIDTINSDVAVDFDLHARPAMCQKDIGRDEFLVSRAMAWLTWPGDTPPNPNPSERTLAPTQSAVYTYYLQNQSQNMLGNPPVGLGIGSGYTETVTVTLTSSKGWAEGFITDTLRGINPGATEAVFPIGPGEIVELGVKVTVPPGAPASLAGDDSTKEVTTLSYQAAQCPAGAVLSADSNPARTLVETNRSFEIASDNSGGPILPGQTITYSHILTNTGNIADDYLITPGASLYAIGDVAQPASYLVEDLQPGMTATLVVSVTIKAEAAGGLTDISGFTAKNSVGDEQGVSNFTAISYTTGTRYVSLAGFDSLVDETVGSADPNAIDVKDNNCTQPDIDACRSLQHALNQAAPGDLIKIEQGLYNVVGVDVISITHASQTLTQTAFINKEVMLQGGYLRTAWDESPPNHISYTTTLNPQGLGRAIFVAALAPTEAVTIDRLTLADGSAGAGGLLYNEGTNLALHAVRLQDGAADSGGGMYHAAGNLLLQNSMLHGSDAISGGALFIASGAATLHNNTFYSNTASNSGGALYAAGGSLTISNTIFASSTGDAVALAAPVTPALDYNLYHANTAEDFVQGGNTTPPGGQNLFGDPRFINPAANPPNLHLQSASPARDSGDPATHLTIDYDNDDRPLPPIIGGYDRGADERVPVQGLLFYSDTLTSTLPGGQVVITHTLQNTGDITDVFTISAGSSQGWPIAFDQPLPYTITLSSGLSQTVVVTYSAPLTAAGQTNVTLITATSTLATKFAAVRDEIKVKAAAWDISKSVTPAGPVQPGDTLTYTLTITNSGDRESTLPYTITDVLPEHTHYVTADPAPLTTNPVTWVDSTPITVDEAFSVTLVVTVTRPLTTGAAIINQTYSITGGGAPTGTVGAPVTVLVDAPASLTATKQASAALVRPGEYLTYTLAITNQADAVGPALNVVVTDTLPADVAPVGWGFTPPATGTVSQVGRGLTWTLTSAIQPGHTAELTVTVRVTSPLAAPASLTNSFGVSASNIAARLAGQLATPVSAANAITLAKTVNPTTTISGGVVTYTITLTNSGDSIAAVALTDTLEPAFAASPLITDVTVPGRAWDAAAGVTTLTFTATAPITPERYYNAALTITYDITAATLLNTAPITVTAPPTEITLRKTPAVQYAELGDAVTFTIAITNTGLAALRPITITDVLAPACSATLPAGLAVQGQHSYQCAMPAVTADLTNTAVVTGLPALGFGLPAVATDTARVMVITPGLTLSKETATPLVRSGGAASFTLTVTNSGDITLTNVAVADAPACNQSIGALPPLSHTTYTCQMPNVTASFTNTAQASGDAPNGRTLTATAEAAVQVVAPALTVAKLPALQSVAIGAPVSFTITLTNSGDITLTNLIISDAVTPDCDGAAAPNLSPAGLAGATHTFTCTHTGAVDDFTNTVAVTGAVALLPGEIVTASASAVVNVIRPAITVTKQPAFQYARSGQSLTFTLTVSNSGGIALNDVAISDPAIAGCAFAGLSLLPGEGTGRECATVVTADLTNTVYVTGTPISGGNPVTATATAQVDVAAPGLLVAKLPLSQTVAAGGSANFTVTVTNTGDITLTVTLTDTPTTACNHTFATVPPNGGAVSHTCAAANVTATFTNTVTATGWLPGLGAVVSDTAAAAVQVRGAHITVSKTPDWQYVRGGGIATFTIAITNTGDSLTLDPITVTDVLAPACSRVLTNTFLFSGIGTSFSCGAAVNADLVNTVVVTGVSPTGERVSAADSAAVQVITPALTLAKLPLTQTIPGGGSASFTITVTNSGNITLTGVTITDPLAPACSRALGSVVTSASYTCVVTQVTASFVNTATAAALAPDNGVVTGESNPAAVTVVNAALQLSKQPAIQYIQPGGSATFTLTVTNTGPITLQTVILADALAPACNTTFTSLAPNGGSDSITCARSGVSGSFTNTAVATGTTALGEQALATAQAYVDAQLPGVPALISPPDQSYTNTTGVTFRWGGVSAAVTYTLNVSGSLSSVPAPATSAAATLSEGVYTWTVRAIDAHGRASAYAAAWQVTVDTTPPSAPVLQAPANGQVISATRRPGFVWDAAVDALSGPVTYTIIITGPNGSQINTTATAAFTPTNNLLNGVYTWTVRAEDRAGNVAGSAQVFTFTLQSQVGDLYLPIVLKDFVAQPDLTPIALIVEPSTGLGPTTPVVLGVVVQNQGTATAAKNFWVDFYINPRAGLPTTAGKLWSDSSGSYCGNPCYGLAWQVGEALAPGQVITLTSQGIFSGYLWDDYTVWPGYFNSSGTQRVGVYVDSWNGATPNGFILESDETNNALGLLDVGVSGAATDGLDVSEAQDRPVPPRPLPAK